MPVDGIYRERSECHHCSKRGCKVVTGMMVLFHCESNPGYAASSHEHTFLEVAKHLTGDIRQVHYAYADLEAGMTSSLPSSLTNVIQLRTRWSEPDQLKWIEDYVRAHKITYVLGFDQPVSRPAYRALRKGCLFY